MTTASDTVMQQYEAVRRSGKTNMLDTSTVQVIAHESDFHALVTFIEDSTDVEYMEMAESTVELGYPEMDDLPVGDVPDKITREVTIYTQRRKF